MLPHRSKSRKCPCSPACSTRLCWVSTTSGRSKRQLANSPSSNLMLIGYARVSTHEQNLELQKDALETAGCERVFVDTLSGATVERPGLEEALTFARPGDTIVVWRLD